MKVGILFTGLALTAALTGLAAPASTVDLRPIGRWDITIMQDGLMIPSWIEIRSEADKLIARFCSEVRGVYDAGEVKVEGNEITFKSIDQSAYPDHWYTYKGTIKDDSMVGSRSVGNDPKQHWFARRFVPTANVAGQWSWVGAQGQDNKAAIIVLRQYKKDIVGTYWEPATGRELTVIGMKLNGEALTFDMCEVVPGKGDRKQIQKGDVVKTVKAKIKGDVLEGTETDTDGKVTPLTALRKREWCEPIHLFNGKNLDGWKPLRDPSGRPRENKWSVVNGIMTCAGRSMNIVSKQQFMDFKIHVEFRVPERGNSGVYLRGRYEIQVADSFGKPATSDACGGMYSRITPAVNASKPANEWQTFDAMLVGQYITLQHNGVTIMDNRELEGITGGAIDSHEQLPGPIYLQGDHSKIEYRKIIIYPALPEPHCHSGDSQPAK